MNKAKIAVLLCTYNGEKHIEEQLESIALQDHQDIDIYVSDDGSTDNTATLLDKYKKGWSKGTFTVRSGPQKGFANNFLSLVCDENIEADFFAYCDQDDIWEKDKLSRAIRSLVSFENTIAALYCSRTTIVTEAGETTGKLSCLFTRKPSFQNALVQSLAGGNTMLFNRQTKQLISRVGIHEIVSHDWWTYMLVTGVGGKVIYDTHPTVRYRQHENNEIGANTSWTANLSRVLSLLNGRFKKWNEINLRALKTAKPFFTRENQKTLEQFERLREANLHERFRLAKRAKLYRQSHFGTIALMGATILKKL